jgi:large subunit ribosomal protein L23
MKDLFQVIDTLQLSEKASLLTETQNQYVFRVNPKANKLEIKEAVQKLFGKKVVSVRTANYAGKKKRQRRADYGRTAHWKKAVVKLAEGESIDLI